MGHCYGIVECICLFVDRVLLCSSAGLQVMIPLGQLPGCCSDRPVSSLCFLRRASMPGVSGLTPFATPSCSRKLLTRCLPDSNVIGLEFSASRTESQTISVLYVPLSLGYLAIAAKKIDQHILAILGHFRSIHLRSKWLLTLQKWCPINQRAFQQ